MSRCFSLQAWPLALASELSQTAWNHHRQQRYTQRRSRQSTGTNISTGGGAVGEYDTLSGEAGGTSGDGGGGGSLLLTAVLGLACALAKGFPEGKKAFVFAGPEGKLAWVFCASILLRFRGVVVYSVLVFVLELGVFRLRWAVFSRRFFRVFSQQGFQRVKLSELFVVIDTTLWSTHFSQQVALFKLPQCRANIGYLPQ